MLLEYFKIIIRLFYFLIVPKVKFPGSGPHKVFLRIYALIIACLLLLGSAIIGRAFDAGYLRPVLLAGSILLVFTTCMTSLATEWQQLFLAQGIGGGAAQGV